MSYILPTLLAVAILVVNMVIHEAAHAVALHRLGFMIEKSGVGISLPPRWRLAATARRPFTVTITPWLLGAWVAPAERDIEAIEAMPYRDYALYAGAGTWANMVTMSACWTVLAIVDGGWISALVAGAVGLAVACRPRQFCAFVAPVLGWFALALVAWSVVSMPGTDVGVIGNAKVFVSNDFGYVADLLVLVPLALTLFNMMPLGFLDGGKVMTRILHDRLPDRVAVGFQRVTTAALMGFFGYALLTDFVFTGR
jgi:membrane-associated protease RseP (regulator of RpoE activity)